MQGMIKPLHCFCLILKGAQNNQLILQGETLKENTEVLWGFTKN